MSQRHRYKRLDDRTGRLERAVNLINDGMIPGILVKRGEEDKPHPQLHPRQIGPDRADLKARKDVDSATLNFTYRVGYTANSNFIRPSVTCASFGTTSGRYTYFLVTEYGYSVGGYGQFGYSGLDEGPNYAGQF